MKFFVKYGLCTGAISGLWGIICFTAVVWLNRTLFHQSFQAMNIRSYTGLFSILILIMGIYLGMKQARLRMEGTLTYWQAVKTGVFVACIAAVTAACFSW